MDKSLYLEKNISQQPAIDLLRSMGYTYISPEDCEAQRGSRYHVLLKDILRGQLRRLNRYAFAGCGKRVLRRQHRASYGRSGRAFN